MVLSACSHCVPMQVSKARICVEQRVRAQAKSLHPAARAQLSSASAWVMQQVACASAMQPSHAVLAPKARSTQAVSVGSQAQIALWTARPQVPYSAGIEPSSRPPASGGFEGASVTATWSGAWATSLGDVASVTAPPSTGNGMKRLGPSLFDPPHAPDRIARLKMVGRRAMFEDPFEVPQGIGVNGSPLVAVYRKAQ